MGRILHIGSTPVERGGHKMLGLKLKGTSVRGIRIQSPAKRPLNALSD
jgi:hypothetical protein